MPNPASAKSFYTVIACVAGIMLQVGTAGCWYHRIAVPSPVMEAGPGDSNTDWAFLWRSNRADTTGCGGMGMKEVTFHSNVGFALIRVVTLGLVGPVRVERRCAKPMIIEEDSDTAASAPPQGATQWSLGWGSGEAWKRADCNDRPLSQVAMRPNPFFDLIALVALLGAAAPARVGWECVPKDSLAAIPEGFQ